MLHNSMENSLSLTFLPTMGSRSYWTRSQWGNFLPSWLTDSLVFPDRETKVVNNLRIEDITRELSNCAFLYVQSYVSTDNKCGVSLSKSRPEADETYLFTGYMR